jgi:AcrR family transcriptional regulator
MSGPGAGARSKPPTDRGRVVTAFVELVAERGYQHVELSEASARAELPPGAAERYFPDRLACFEAGWDFLERLFVDRLQVAYEPLEDWRDRLRAAAGETARLLEHFPKQAHFLAVDALSVGEAGRARQQALAARLAVFLDEAREDLSDPGAAPAATSGWVIGLFFDRIYRYTSTGREEQFARDLPELMFLSVSSYFGPEAGLSELRDFDP